MHWRINQEWENYLGHHATTGSGLFGVYENQKVALLGGILHEINAYYKLFLLYKHHEEMLIRHSLPTFSFSEPCAAFVDDILRLQKTIKEIIHEIDTYQTSRANLKMKDLEKQGSEILERITKRDIPTVKKYLLEAIHAFKELVAIQEQLIAQIKLDEKWTAIPLTSERLKDEIARTHQLFLLYSQGEEHIRTYDQYWARYNHENGCYEFMELVRKLYDALQQNQIETATVLAARIGSVETKKVKRYLEDMRDGFTAMITSQERIVQEL